MINLIHWLKEKDAVNIAVLVEKLPDKLQTSKLDCLLDSKSIRVSFKPLNKLISVEDATQLIQETSETAPVDSIFFISLVISWQGFRKIYNILNPPISNATRELSFQDSCSKTIHFMDMALQQSDRNIKFISLFSGGLEEMELRQKRGMPAFVLHGDDFPRDISKVMIEFEKILSRYDLDNSGDVLYRVICERNASSNTLICYSSTKLKRLISRVLC